MISSGGLQRLVRLQRLAFFVAVPSLLVMLLGAYVHISPALGLRVVGIAVLSGSMWMGIHHGLLPLATGRSRLWLLFFTTDIPGPLARLIGLVYVLIGVLGVLAGLLVTLIA